MKATGNILLIIILLSLTTQISCVTQKTQKQEDPGPDWVQQRPIIPGYYIGIGTVPKIGLPTDYVPKARNQALNDMAGGISSMVSSTSVLFKIENQYGGTEGYSQHISVETNEYMEGFEPYAAYETESRYWVMYQVSRDVYEQKKLERKTKAIQSAVDLQTGAFQHEQNDDVLAAIKGYIQALTLLKNHLGESNNTIINGKDVELGGYLLSKIESLRSNIIIEAKESAMVVKRQEISKHPVFYTIKFNNEPLFGAPIKLRYSGGYLVRDKLTSDNQGQIQVQISTTAATTTQNYLVATLDWKEIVQNTTTDLAMRRLLEPISMPEKSISIVTTSPTIAFRFKNNNLVSADEMEQRFLGIVQKYTLVLAEEPAKADFIIDVRFETEQGESAAGLTSVFCFGTQKISYSDGKLIKQSSGQKTRGVADTKELAEKQAVNNYLTDLFVRYIPALLNEVD